ncbi:hypothetical protein ACSFA7_00660 [Variovorax sp. LT1R20]|uniref:hypothetical protein n=1 Tax=Variovorax sp. LT1R20 TaxID=3443729 RepID=UPI003F44DFF1
MAATLATWFAAILTVLILVPFSTSFPDGSLDMSWMHALNVAAGKNLQFGRDLIFTFGPLATVYSRQYFPATDTAMLAGALLIAGSLFLSFRTISGAQNRAWLLALPFLLSQANLLDPIFLGLPLSVLLASAKPAKERYLYVSSLLLGMAAISILLLIKGSALPTVVFCGGATLAVVWRRSVMLASLGAVVFVSTLLVAWVACGQAISNLPAYFMAQTSIISGYTDAMSTLGRRSDIAVYALCALLLLRSAWHLNRQYRWIFLSATGLFFFLCFKAGFVRHDGHAIAAAFAPVFVAFLCLVWLPRWSAVAALGIAALNWGFIASNVAPVTPMAVAESFRLAVRSGAAGIVNRAKGIFLFDEAFERANASIRTAHPLPVSQGTADLYPSDISVLLASGNNWTPRPIPQSYSAYTQGLARANADHLRIAGPDWVFFSVAPIDDRYPTIEDGASWPVLLNQYRVTQLAGSYAVLARDTSVSPFDLGAAVSQRTMRLGELIDVPALDSPMFVQIDVRPTAIGRAASIAFKSPQLHLTATYPDGKSRAYRYIAGMGQSGFLLAPTISSAIDFAKLKSSNWKSYLGHQIPVKFGIFGDSGTRFAWQGSFEVKFFKLPVAHDAAIEDMLRPAQSTPPR